MDYRHQHNEHVWTWCVWIVFCGGSRGQTLSRLYPANR